MFPFKLWKDCVLIDGGGSGTSKAVLSFKVPPTAIGGPNGTHVALPFEVPGDKI